MTKERTRSGRRPREASARLDAVGADGSSPPSRLEELGVTPWDTAVLVATVFIAVVAPIQVVFESLDAWWLRSLSLVTAVVLALDIRRRLANGHDQRRYLRSWFTVDLLAAIPFDVLADIPGLDGTWAASVIRFLGLLRVLRIARVFLLQREWRVRTSFNPAVLRLAFFAFWIALLSHWIACGWIALDGPDSGHPELLPYQQALYWTITTLTTVGYGDITPVGRGQVTYTMVVMALGAAMYGYIIGNVASLLANLDVLRARHLSRMEMINHFMRDRRIPRDLQAQVRDYYNYLWDSRLGGQSELLDDLPQPLRIEIALHINRDILRKVPLFEGASDAFLRDLVLHLEPMVFLPGQALMRRGEIGHRIYFISQGRIDVLAHDESQVIATLSDGDFVGEMALLSSQPRSNTVIALDYCNVYALDRKGFDRVLENFPDVAAEVRRIAAVRRAESASED